MVGVQLISPSIPLIPGATCQTPVNSSAFGYGRGLISTAFTTLKMAVVAPMPRASVTSAMVVNPGAHARRRNTNLSELMVNITGDAGVEFRLDFDDGFSDILGSVFAPCQRAYGQSPAL